PPRGGSTPASSPFPAAPKPSLSGGSSPPGLCVIAARRAIDPLRRIRRQDLREVHAPLAFEDHADQSADPTRGLVHADTSGVVARAIASLPARQRQAVQHLVLEVRSLADAAALTRRTAGSLKVKLHPALKA